MKRRLKGWAAAAAGALLVLFVVQIGATVVALLQNADEGRRIERIERRIGIDQGEPLGSVQRPASSASADQGRGSTVTHSPSPVASGGIGGSHGGATGGGGDGDPPSGSDGGGGGGGSGGGESNPLPVPTLNPTSPITTSPSSPTVTGGDGGSATSPPRNSVVDTVVEQVQGTVDQTQGAVDQTVNTTTDTVGGVVDGVLGK